jgi:hypothetical protein
VVRGEVHFSGKEAVSAFAEMGLKMRKLPEKLPEKSTPK